jgi:hypothetical protein
MVTVSDWAPPNNPELRQTMNDEGKPNLYFHFSESTIIVIIQRKMNTNFTASPKT